MMIFIYNNNKSSMLKLSLVQEIISYFKFNFFLNNFINKICRAT